jgi:hypothetical protein
VDRFFHVLECQQYRSELGESYQKRLLKHRKSLFTFLQHDGIPWNNNSAEHAVHRFAYYRTISDGKMTESGLGDYLILLSIYQTCRYKGISFLKFLLSREEDIDRFIEQGTDKRKVSSSLELYPDGFSSNHPRRRGAPIKRNLRFMGEGVGSSCGVESLSLNSLDPQPNTKGSERVHDHALTTSGLH